MLRWISAICGHSNAVASLIVSQAGSPGSVLRALLFLYRHAPHSPEKDGWPEVLAPLNSAISVLTVCALKKKCFSKEVAETLKKVLPILCVHMPHPCKRGLGEGAGDSDLKMHKALSLVLRWSWSGGAEELQTIMKELAGEGDDSAEMVVGAL